MMSDPMAEQPSARMSERERIHQLEREGKITPAEAEQLLAALGDEALGDEWEREVAERPLSAVEGADVEGADATPASAERPLEPQPEPQPQPQPEPQPAEGLRWVRIRVLAGDLDVRVDPALLEPQVESGRGSVSVSREGDGFLIAAGREKADKGEKPPRREGVDGVLDGIGEVVSNLLGRVGDLEIRIPQGFGVIIESKAGDVDVEGVPFVKAKLLAGDLDLRQVGGVELEMSAGDVDATLLLTHGRHSIKVSAGDVDVTLLPGSSVTVLGRVGMGEVQASPPFHAERSGMGGKLAGRLGEGAAALSLALSAGDLELRGG